MVLSGIEKGKTGKVLEAFPALNRVVVEGINIHKKSQRPRKAGQHGQIVDKQGSIHASKLMEIGKHKEKQSKKK